jgi:PAS domain S-box-containing protein
MFNEKPFNVLLFCVIVTISTAVLQYLNPGVGFFDYGLIIAILLTVFVKRTAYTIVFGITGILFVTISSFYSHENMTGRQVLTQHLFSGVIIVLTTLAVLYIKKLYRSIETDEQQMNALFEHATEGIILTDSKGKIVLVNPAALALFKYEKGELLGKSVETLIPGRFHANHLNLRNEFYQHPSNRTMGHGRDLFAKTKDGNEFPVEVSLSFYRQHGEAYVIAFIIDITLRKKTDQELLNQKIQLEKITEDMKKLNSGLETKVEQRTLILREALQELEKSQGELNEALNKEKELNEIKSRFVSMASHEFRTPLSTVLSSAALISKYTQSDDQEKRDKHIKRIKDSVKHLNILLEDFLSLGKLEEGKIKAGISQFNLKEFMDEVVDEMKSILKEKQSIHYAYQGNDSFVSDKRLVKNILINLLSNAVKFSADDAGIWLTVSNDDKGMKMAVLDEGIGMSAEDQQHLFSSFFRGKNAINIEGTGLGLHIVKKYVDLLLGDVKLKSELDKGTTITVELPLLRIDHEFS